uniref:Ah24 n=1 Tax=Amaranthus hypochondriacus TaxID=28502 RepID=S4S5M3_AMAHP|nr:Ah24 [Amaranthus hypochondriacus]AKO71445.1 Ah24 [Amaranthus hypochondriacus]
MAEIEAQVYSVEDKNADHDKIKSDSKAKASNTVDLRTSCTNLTAKLVRRLEKEHFWAGRAVTVLSAIAPGTYGVPTQRGELPAGVKWGVAYADGPDSTARKWVVAFDTAAQKAYAEAGPTGPIDWNVVEVKLGFSGSKTEVEDPILGGKCTDEIDGLNAWATFR